MTRKPNTPNTGKPKTTPPRLRAWSWAKPKLETALILAVLAPVVIAQEINEARRARRERRQ